MAKRHFHIIVQGIVQGVGFRPFVYRLANNFSLHGFVCNSTDGVHISIEGEQSNIDAFLENLRKNPPPLSIIKKIEISENNVKGYTNFRIIESQQTTSREAFVSPDIALCDDCIHELLNPADIRYHYPFITCTNCGPRFSIVEDIPYDRNNTSMKTFPMCVRCHAEYENPIDRRFHAQPNACAACGPHLTLYDAKAQPISHNTDEIIDAVISAITNGSIIAIKSIGGFCIACDAQNDAAVQTLRMRKMRPFKPFALMAGSIDVIEQNAKLSVQERALLLSRARPIVLLEAKQSKIAPSVAPGLSYYGFMLPYAPIHYLIFEKAPHMILVMTSGNIADEPIIYRNHDALNHLSKIADLCVTYNREIVAQSDDSVLFVEKELPFFIRRSRGYVPTPLLVRNLPCHILATGSDLKNSFALARDDFIVLGQYIGDLSMATGDEVYRRTLEHFMRIYNFNPTVVVSDIHPAYLTTYFADELQTNGIQRFSVQHHHAHIASILEEHNVDGPVIGIAFDGTGYGTDGTLWGSEFLIATRQHFERSAHFSEFQLPGGESAIRDVWKIAVSLQHAFAIDDKIKIHFPDEDIILEIMKKNINSPLATSVGRLFDGISAILGIRKSVSTEAEAAMLLEEAAYFPPKKLNACAAHIDEKNGIIDTGHFVRRVLELLSKGEDVSTIARVFHDDIALTTVNVAIHLREKYGISTIALSGGAFQNRLLLRTLIEHFLEKGFDLLLPRSIPFNDGCIAVGQICIARELLK